MQKSVYRNLLAGLFTATALTASGQLFPFHSGDSLSILPTPGQNESYLGTYLSEVTPELVDQLSLQEESGAHVNQVHNKYVKKLFGFSTKDEARQMARKLVTVTKACITEHEADAILVVEAYKELIK